MLARRIGAPFCALTILLAFGAVSASASTPPKGDQEMPFPCRQEWYGSSRSYHSPSPLAVDWNRADDLGDPVVASAAGVVTRVENLGSRSYGLFLIVDHGGGETTLYAHLSAEFVTVGQTVDQGELIAAVGSSGGSTGPHLHYEQRLNGTDYQAWFHDVPFQMNTTLRSRNCVDTPLAGDWNGDGVAQIGLFRRAALPKFRLAWGADVRVVPFGGPTDTPLVGDWDGDGISDQGVRQGGTSTFLLRRKDGRSTSMSFGLASDRAVTGDWNGDGISQVGVWRPSEAAFLLRTVSGRVRKITLGSVGSLPVTGDWNGDGRTDLGVYSRGTWTLKLQGAATPWTGTVALGGPSDLPLTGDWNGDGATDLGTWRPSTALFTLRKAAPQSSRTGTLITRPWGRPR